MSQFFNECLKNNIIARYEKDKVLLYNGKNEALIKLSREFYFNLKNKKVIINDINKKVIKILQDNQILDKEEENLKSDNLEKKLSKKEENRVLYRINSDIAPFNVMWSVTSHCNMKCVYCFPNVKASNPLFDDLSIEKLHKIADQLIKYKIFRVIISGGEFTLKKGIWTVIDKLYNAGITLTLLSNGINVDAELIKKIKKYKLPIGISLDSYIEEVNSITRGKGTLKKILCGLNNFLDNGIYTSVLITLTKFNYPTLYEHIKFLNNLNIKNITIQDLRPFGTKKDYDMYRLTVDQESGLISLLNKIKNDFSNIKFSFTELLLYISRARKTTGNIMNCPAGSNSLYINYKGELFPCTSYPLKMGKIFKDGDLSEIWQNSQIVKDLRKMKNMPVTTLENCKDCKLNYKCEGGCRGDALFYSQDILGTTSRCPKSMGILEKLNFNIDSNFENKSLEN